MPGAFNDVRVVDLSTRLSGAYAARMFGDFGADVVLAESTAEHPLRAEAPFAKDAPDVSLLHAYANWNKRSSAAIDAAELAATADILVTTEAPLSARAQSAVEALPDNAIHLSITPHGLEGPLASAPGNNLTTCATVGWSIINRYFEDVPLQLPLNQTGYIAGVAGFVGASAAFFKRMTKGHGDRVDVSEDEAVAETCAPWAIMGLFAGGDRVKYGVAGGGRPGQPGPLYRTADGLMNFGYGDWARWASAMQVLGLPEMAEDPEYAPVLGRNQTDPTRIRNALAEAASTQKKWDVFHGLAGVRCISGVVQNMRELVESDQLNARGFFVPTSIGAEDSAVQALAPAAPAKLSGSPWAHTKSAPALGADDDALTSEHREPLAVPTTKPEAVRELPLAGIRVLTFTQAWAGTFATELLAFLGADVVQVETVKRPDVWRGAGAPVPPAIRDDTKKQSPLNTNGMYNSVNLDKRSINLDMTHPKGREMFWQLVPQFDVLADNFSPHVMPNWGVTLETLRQHRPDIIFASASGFGTEGPLAEYPANGATTEPMSGLSSLHGYSGGESINTGGLIPDPITGYYFAAAILTALNHRARTGEGQRVDIGMIEAVAVQTGDAILEYTTNGVVRGPSGNLHPRIAPHAVYRCAGEDEWLALAAETEAAWQALAARTGNGLATDPRFATMASRKQHEAELDEIIGDWLASKNAIDEAAALQDLGIAAARCQEFKPTYANPSDQFRAREFLASVTHPESGTHLIPVEPWHFKNAARRPTTYSPCFGEHSREVFAETLGVSDAEYDKLVDLEITGTERVFRATPS